MSEVEVYFVNKLKFCARDKKFVGKKNRARDIPRFLIVESKCLCVPVNNVWRYIGNVRVWVGGGGGVLRKCTCPRLHECRPHLIDQV